MINRLLIRIKTLQILYNYYRVKGMSVNGAIKILQQALDHSYQLYLYLCGLPLELAHIAEQRLAKEEEKFRKDLDIISIYRHLSSNKMVNVIKNDNAYCTEHERLSKLMTTRGLSNFYQTLTTNAIAFIQEQKEPINWEDLANIRSAWRNFYAENIVQNELFIDLVEEISTYINDDISTIFTFVTKTYNAISEEKEYSKVLKPAFIKEENKNIGPTLLKKAIEQGDEYRELISKYFKNWDKERVSEIDYIIMQLALTEAIHFPTTATRIILNEYLNLAHYYSATNSYIFINGILHELFSDLKKEGRILGE